MKRPRRPERKADASFSAADVAYWRRPIVYVWYRDKVPYYVGYSSQGIVRPVSPSHHVIKTLAPEDSIRIWFFDTAREASEAEKRFIRWLRPFHNLTAKMSSGRRSTNESRVAQ